MIRYSKYIDHENDKDKGGEQVIQPDILSDMIEIALLILRLFGKLYDFQRVFMHTEFS